MSEPAKKRATYEDLFSIPENAVGEIIDGELFVSPRPKARHSHAASVLGGEVLPPYHLGRGGPGGWVILHETEILLGENLLVPDLAGWRRERFPGEPEENWIAVSPDWVCEILSPSTARLDKVRKMPIYAQYEVPYLWLVDPAAKTLDVFALAAGRWMLLAAFAEDDTVRADPFAEIEINLKELWLE
jgi:Uma2 family endonuclease